MKKLTPQSIKNIYHLFQAILANVWYGKPSRKIKVIGVTGTNGKTTTCQMITKILEESGAKVAMASTINFKLGEKECINKTKFTTLSSFEVQKFIKEAVSRGCQYLVLEVSSHALDQNRVWGINFDTAVITNVTREHLDYHETIEKYNKAKLKLFRKTRVAIVNLDMEKPENYTNCNAEEIYGYSIESQKSKVKSQNCNSKVKIIKAEEIEVDVNYSKFKIQNSKFVLNLLGRFNIENALAATCVSFAYGISPEIIKSALEKIKGVPGRMEFVPNNRQLNIIIDYAVTPDSLEKLYDLVSQIKCHSQEGKNPENKDWVPNQVRDGNNRVIAVFGACGERDRGKRPIMGEIVDKYADYAIVTNEDPYNEDPARIINEVSAGIRNKKEDENFWKIIDRREAIKKALALAGPGDYVVVTGKGAEEIMAVGKKRIPWNDKKVVLEEL